MLCNFSIRKTAVLASAMVAILTACSTAEAQVKAFKISGEGVGPGGLPLPGQPAREHWITGNGTHLGLHYGEGSVQTDSAVIHFDPVSGLPTHITGEFGSGPGGFTFIAANGDKLACHYGQEAHGASEPGSLLLTVVGFTEDFDLIVEALWIAEFVPDPDDSTGRFAGIDGSWIMYAQSEPFVLGSDDPVHYSWEGEGKLEFAKGKP